MNYDNDKADYVSRDDLERAFGPNHDDVDNDDDILDIVGILNEATIARLDQVAREAFARLALIPRGPVKRRPKLVHAERPRMGSIMEVDFASGEWVIEDLEDRNVYRMAKAIIPKRLWGAMGSGELIYFAIDRSDVGHVRAIGARVNDSI